jgi:hypothetical protein
MDSLEAIRRAQATRLVSEDGDEVELELAPGLLPADIEGLADEVGAPLSRELRTLLERTAAIDGGPLDAIDFTGGPCPAAIEVTLCRGGSIDTDDFARSGESVGLTEATFAPPRRSEVEQQRGDAPNERD